MSVEPSLTQYACAMGEEVKLLLGERWTARNLEVNQTMGKAQWKVAGSKILCLQNILFLNGLLEYITYLYLLNFFSLGVPVHTVRAKDVDSGGDGSVR